ncbi:MAG TPA: HAD-IC family P-type ATPase, partial [Gammaproteobacteria bacterium]
SALAWWQIDPQRIVDTTLAILIAACPCALVLAAPAVLTAASGRLAVAGVWLIRSEALETLSQIDYVVFDKTGTLTSGHSYIEAVRLRSDVTADQALEYAAALEQHSRHPYAAAFIRSAKRKNLQATGVQLWEHRGISGEINGETYRIGTCDFVSCAKEVDADHVWLADSKGMIAVFSIGDPLRHDASALIEKLRQIGMEIEILSGDHASRVGDIADRLGIRRYHSQQSSADKLQRICQLQAAGKKVLMIGDGANDMPVLSAADVSIAVNGGSAMAQSSADLLLVGQSILPVLDAIVVARRARNIIRQNIAWSLLYNASFLPLAVLGMLQPWVAAIGMPASSLLVILNAMRISQRKQDK